MKITQVEYRRLVSTGEYSNLVVGGTATVEPGEIAGAVLDELRRWVEVNIETELAERQAARETRALVSSYESRRAELEQQIDSAERRWAAIRGFFETNSIPLPDRWQNDLPF